uniref:Uncharacterized protein n=1 Tax=Polytomella parva TaxID=51329 RepID=A0A7S0VAF5_9CHLO
MSFILWKNSNLDTQVTNARCNKGYVALRKLSLASSSRKVLAKGTKKLIALDFDGVICDSVNESSMSAFKAACVQWPVLFRSEHAQSSQKHLIDLMRISRPVVETGFENVVLIRCLLEGVPVEKILTNWSTILAEKMVLWNLNRNELIKIFAEVRDDWIQKDLKGWIHANRLYPSPAAVLKKLVSQRLAHSYIVTTKQARYTDLILREMAGIELDPDHIISQTVSGRPKSEVLEELGAKHPETAQQPRSRIFVEDKLSTLEKTEKMTSLKDWELILVDWGYNTDAERKRTVASENRINVIGTTDFEKVLLE